MKQYRMPLILGCVALILAGLSLALGIVELMEIGLSYHTLFAAIIFIGGLLSGINLLRLHQQLKNRKPPQTKSHIERKPTDLNNADQTANQSMHKGE